jgi:hypothetical protein
MKTVNARDLQKKIKKCVDMSNRTGLSSRVEASQPLAKSAEKESNYDQSSV